MLTSSICEMMLKYLTCESSGVLGLNMSLRYDKRRVMNEEGREQSESGGSGGLSDFFRTINVG